MTNEVFKKKQVKDKDGNLVDYIDPKTNDFVMELVSSEVVPDVLQEKDKQSRLITILDNSSDNDLKEFKRRLDLVTVNPIQSPVLSPEKNTIQTKKP